MMPEMDGFRIHPVLPQESETPVILLTAKLEESDKVIGLELGADDYITKPSACANWWRASIPSCGVPPRIPHPSSRLQIGEILLDRETHSVTVSERAGPFNAVRVRPAGRC